MNHKQALGSRKNIVKHYRKQMPTIQAVQKQDMSAKPTEEPNALPLKWLADEPLWVG